MEMAGHSFHTEFLIYYCAGRKHHIKAVMPHPVVLLEIIEYDLVLYINDTTKLFA